MSPASERSPRRTSKSTSQTTGWLAEELVAHWLMQQGSEIIQRRWHCRWGELDLIAHCRVNTAAQHSQAIIAFVEVKARREGNWDLDGLLALTPQKQQKLWKTAELFLSDYPQLANLPCRFDVALVHVHSTHIVDSGQTKASLGSDDRSQSPHKFDFKQPIEPGKPVMLAGYSLSLQHYIQSAFDLT